MHAACVGHLAELSTSAQDHTMQRQEAFRVLLWGPSSQ